MASPLQDILVRRFGHKRLRPIQRDVIGRVMDGGDGQYFMRNRWYEPHTGRFLSEDVRENLSPREPLSFGVV